MGREGSVGQKNWEMANSGVSFPFSNLTDYLPSLDPCVVLFLMYTNGCRPSVAPITLLSSAHKYLSCNHDACAWIPSIHHSRTLQSSLICNTPPVISCNCWRWKAVVRVCRTCRRPAHSTADREIACRLQTAVQATPALETADRRHLLLLECSTSMSLAVSMQETLMN